VRQRTERAARKAQHRYRDASTQPQLDSFFAAPRARRGPVAVKIFALSVMALGVLVSLVGLSAMNAASSDMSRFLQDAAPDHTRWIMLGGVAVFAAGVAMLVVAIRKRGD
jgi:uncharacterized protein DUF3185